MYISAKAEATALPLNIYGPDEGMCPVFLFARSNTLCNLLGGLGCNLRCDREVSEIARVQIKA